MIEVRHRSSSLGWVLGWRDIAPLARGDRCGRGDIGRPSFIVPRPGPATPIGVCRNQPSKDWPAGPPESNRGV